MKRSKKHLTTKTFDKLFDAGHDMGDYLDKTKSVVGRKSHRVNIDFPDSLLQQIDHEAERAGVARTALIKIWLAERLERMA